jgi:lipid-binding SYLF domain-containing protein
MTRILSPFTTVIRTVALVAIATLGASLDARAADDLDRRVQRANWVLQDLQRIPEQAIPPNLLNSAYAVAVIPNTVKLGFIIGGSFGRGVLLVRQPDGAWSNPSFITLTNLGLGWQAGAQGADLVLVFRTRGGVENIARGKFTLGGSASASAGPVGRTAQALTDGEFRSEIYTYARSRGLFAGVSLDGGAITIDQEANAAWYAGAADTSARTIFTDRSLAAPASAQVLATTLGTMAPRVDWKDTALASQPPEAAPPAETASKTYAIEDGAQPAPETRF